MDLKALYNRADVTLGDLESLTGYAKSTINGLINHGRGSQRLQEKLAAILKVKCGLTEKERRAPEVFNDSARPDEAGSQIDLALLPVQILEVLVKDLVDHLKGVETDERETLLKVMIEINRELQRRGKLPALPSYKEKGEK
jgi:hypothetical protein